VRYLPQSTFVDNVARDMVDLARSSAIVCAALAETLRPGSTEDAALQSPLWRTLTTLHMKLAAAASVAAQAENPEIRFIGAQLYETAALARTAADAVMAQARQGEGAERLLHLAKLTAVAGCVARTGLRFVRSKGEAYAGALDAAVSLALTGRGSEEAAIQKSLAALRQERDESSLRDLVLKCSRGSRDTSTRAMEEANEEEDSLNAPAWDEKAKTGSKLGPCKVPAKSKDGRISWSGSADLVDAMLGERELWREAVLTSPAWAHDEEVVDLLLARQDSASFREVLLDWVVFHPHVVENPAVRERLAKIPGDIVAEAQLRRPNAAKPVLVALRGGVVPSKVSVDRLLLSYPPKELARQLCLIDSGLFRKIGAREFLNSAWSKREHKHLAANLLEFIRHVNCVVEFLVSSILLQEKKHDRARALAQTIDLGAELCRLDNYASTFAVVAALSNAAISRLENSWALLEEAHRSALAELKVATDFSHSFQVYRTREAAVRGPCIPHLAVHLGDLIGISEGNRLSNKYGQINVAGYLHLHARTISHIRELQERDDYAFERNEFLQGVLLFPPHFADVPDGDELSRTFEPRKKH
jgi:hypothetical protein